MFLRKPYLKKRFHEFFPALLVPDYRRFLAGRAFGMVGMWVLDPVIPWLVFAITGSDASLGLVKFFGQIPMTLMVISAGVVADRFSRRNLIIATQTGMMLVSFLMGVLAGLGAVDNMLIIYAFVIVNGVFRTLDVPSRQAFLIDMVGVQRLGNAIALRSATFNVARIFGPVASGYLFARFGAEGCFCIKAATFLPIIAVLLTIRKIKPATTGKAAGGASRLIEGLTHAWQRKDILLVLSFWAVFSLFGTSYGVLLASFAKEIYGLEAGGYTLLYSAQGLGAFTAAITLAATSTRAHPQKRAIIGASTVSAMLLLLSVNTSYKIAMILIAILGFGWVSFTVSCDVLLQSLTTHAFRGRIMGLRTFVFGGMFGIGAALTGAIASIDAMGRKGAVALGALVVAATLVILGPRILRIALPSVNDAARNSSDSAGDTE